MPDYPENEIVLVSAIEHYSYCPRQCALIHVEKVFDENIFTLRGRHAHERVDEEPSTDEEGVRMERGETFDRDVATARTSLDWTIGKLMVRVAYEFNQESHLLDRQERHFFYVRARRDF